MTFTSPTRAHLPLILIRGFGGLDVSEERKLTYQGFNDGTVYPQKRGENYIYEGLILRLMKSEWQYRDATNVIGYYASPVAEAQESPALEALPVDFFKGSKIVVDPGMALRFLADQADPWKSLWVFRYYDLGDRTFPIYGEALKRLIDLIRSLVALKTGEPQPKVNIVAHSMGGLIARQAIQVAYEPGQADLAVNKLVTLGTPHRGNSFQLIQDLRWLGIEAADEIAHFNPEEQERPTNAAGYKNLSKVFPLSRLLTVVGTNYRTFNTWPATAMNRLFSVPGEYGMNYNRSDGLVKQTYAQIPGAPRTFVHKCHGGPDSLITSREAFEVATRFFHGDIYVRLRLVEGKITRGRDFFGKSEFFLGVSVKPREVDFDLFHQSKEAENCYGPFSSSSLIDDSPSFGWAGPDRLIWEGWLDTSLAGGRNDLVVRLEVYVSERDLFGIGFSDNVIFHQNCYVRAILVGGLKLYSYADESFAGADEFAGATELSRGPDGSWLLPIGGTGFTGTFAAELFLVPKEGEPGALS